jgi:methylglyoxal synthase
MKDFTRKLTIALVAHDRRKVDMVEWATFNAKFLSKHTLVCTGTTGGLIEESLREKGFPNVQVIKKNSGPLGGDAEIATMVVRNEVDLAIFLIDDLNPHPHEADIQMLLRQCRIWNIPIACNRYTADLLITSDLWNEESYEPSPPKYVEFDRV